MWLSFVICVVIACLFVSFIFVDALEVVLDDLLPCRLFELIEILVGEARQALIWEHLVSPFCETCYLED